MPIEPQSVLIEFVADTSHLSEAITILEKMGTVDEKVASDFRKASAEINKRAEEIKNGFSTASKGTKANLEEISIATKKMTNNFHSAFMEGVMDTLKEAGVSLEEFVEALMKGNAKGAGSLKTVKQELRELTEQIARAKVAGQDYGEAYDELVLKAGRLKDAIGDVGQEVKNAGSDTSNLDGLISAASAVAGGFAVAQGAVALFGDESEDLQKTLLRVNAVMSILQGLQAIQNARLKESAAVRLLDKTQTYAQIAAQKLYALVVGETTGALKAFRIALASTGIGLLVIAIGAIVANWNKVKEAMSGVSEKQRQLVETTRKTVEAENEKLEALNNQDNLLKQQGKSEREILELKIRQTNEVILARQQQLKAQEDIVRTQAQTEKRNRELLKGVTDVIFFLLNGITKSISYVAELFGKKIVLPTLGDFAGLIFNEKEVEDKGKAAREAAQKELDALLNQRAGYLLNIQQLDKAAAEQRLRDQIATIEDRLLTVQAGSKKELDLQKQLINARAHLDLLSAKSAAEMKLINDKKNRDLLQADADFEKARLASKSKGIEMELELVSKGSLQELRLRQQLLQLQAQMELTNFRLTQEERDRIIEESNQRQISLGKEFNEKLAADAIDNAISLNNAQLSLLQTSAQQRLILQIANIELASRKEIEAAKDNAARILEITAKSEEEIRNLKLRYLQETTEAQIAEEIKKQSGVKSVLENILNNERATARERIKALQELTAQDLALLDIRVDALKAANARMLISDDDTVKQWVDILGQKNDINKEAEKKFTEVIKDEQQKRIEAILAAAQAIGQVWSSLNDLQTAQEQHKIDMMKESLQQARDAGAITEKEAITRQKRIDQEEKKLRIQQAQRDKQLAIFNAIINTAEAVTAALTTKGPLGIVLAAIAAAMGAAQIAIIAARPIPKFRHGKKDRYEGPGEVGEAGAEIIERDGRMFVVDKPTITWVAAEDKIFNPEETKRILHQSALPPVNPELLSYSSSRTMSAEFKQLSANFKEMQANLLDIQKALTKLPIQTFSFDEDGFTHSVQQGLSKFNYFEKRYSSRK
jgi:hypothetical protein